MLFCIISVPAYIPTNSVGGFPFLHTLSSISLHTRFLMSGPWGPTDFKLSSGAVCLALPLLVTSFLTDEG